MSKEQLEVFKNVRYLIEDNDRVSLCRDSFDFLIERAEQNGRYRDSIKLALNHIHTGNFNLATVALNKALLDKGNE